MNKVQVCLVMIALAGPGARAQQFGLFNTNTLFDSFENPAQRAFILNESRPFASNFLLPYFGLSGGNRGDVSAAFKNRIIDGNLDTRNIPVGTMLRNKFYGSTTIYLLTFRTSPFYQNNQELGFSWQLKSDAYADYTSESVVALRNYGRFTSSLANPFNGSLYGQSYHQFSMNYRVDEDEGVAYGFKLGLLSGITYNHAAIEGSAIAVTQNKLTVGLTGKYRASFLLTDELSSKTLLPDFKNPGISMTVGATYTSPSGLFIMGNIKDLGLIRWNDRSSTVALDNDKITVNAGNTGNSKGLQRQIVDLLISKNEHKSFYSATNAKIDFLISRRYNLYKPNLIVSKNLFYNGADVVLVNNVQCGDFTCSLSPSYNMNQFFLLGAQALYQSSNCEVFLGTDNLLRSATFFREASYSPKGVIGASLYMGIGIKFGYVQERP